MTLSSRYSQHARRAMTHARVLARDQRHGVVDTGHLLVGILRTEGSIGWRVLHELEMDRAAAERRLLDLHPRVDPLPTLIPMSVPLRMALVLAVEESTLLGHHYIGTEHLLLALARGGEGSAPQLLYSAEITLDQLRRQMRRVLQAGPTEISLEAARRLARLSELSRRVLNRAMQIADDLEQAQADLAHLLLALSQERRSPAGGVLRECGLEVELLAADIWRRPLNTSGALDAVLDDAVRRAEGLGSHYTGTDHLLIALARDRRGARLLRRYGVDPKLLITRLEQRK